MDKTCIFVAYDGGWNEESRYVDYKTHLVLIKDGITLNAFVQKICGSLHIDKVDDKPTIWFDTKIQGNKGMLLMTDDDLEACIYMVKTEAEYRKSHFIVETKSEHQIDSYRPSESETIAAEICCLQTAAEHINDEGPSTLINERPSTLFYENPSTWVDVAVLEQRNDERPSTSSVKCPSTSTDVALEGPSTLIDESPSTWVDVAVLEQRNDERPSTLINECPSTSMDESPSPLMDVSLPSIHIQEIEPLHTVFATKKRKGKKKEALHVEICGENSKLEDIKKHSVFESKETLKKCIANLAVTHPFEFKVERSDNRRVELKCKDKKCSWLLNAAQFGNSSLFRITKHKNIHHCSVDKNTLCKRHLTYRLISDLIKDKVHDPGSNMKPADVIDEIQRNLGVTVSYRKARLALLTSQKPSI